MNNKKIDILDILDMVEFTYKINKNGTVSLVDELGVNLGNIESDEFTINNNLAIAIIDRLSIYIEDYITDDYANTLIEECKEHAYKSDPYLDLLNKMKKYPDIFDEDCLNLMNALDNPNEFIDVSAIINSSKL